MTEKLKTILIIEDEIEILYAIKEYLESLNYRVLAAENGLKALEQIDERLPPDLILLDMKMPVMNGWQFASEFHSKYNDLSPILVMTAAGDVGQRAKDVQAVGWIEKPFDLEDLLELIKRYIR